jgi:hypothetical protein
MTLADTLILAAYLCILVILAQYGWHRCYLMYLYVNNGEKEPSTLP